MHSLLKSSDILLLIHHNVTGLVQGLIFSYFVTKRSFFLVLHMVPQLASVLSNYAFAACLT